jgi:hypothetical protein
MFNLTGVLLLVFGTLTFVLLPVFGYLLYRFFNAKKLASNNFNLKNQQKGINKYYSAFVAYFLCFCLFAVLLIFIFCISMLATGLGLN